MLDIGGSQFTRRRGVIEEGGQLRWNLGENVFGRVDWNECEMLFRQGDSKTRKLCEGVQTGKKSLIRNCTLKSVTEMSFLTNII